MSKRMEWPGERPLRGAAEWCQPAGRPAGAAWQESVWEPPTDIYFTADTVVIRMEIAGVTPEDIDLVAEGRVLTVSGRRQRACDPAVCGYRQVEIHHGAFERRFEFPYPLDDAVIEPSYRDGFLSIRVQPPDMGPRRIAVADA